jgi:hypothetical protein
MTGVPCCITLVYQTGVMAQHDPRDVTYTPFQTAWGFLAKCSGGCGRAFLFWGCVSVTSHFRSAWGRFSRLLQGMLGVVHEMGCASRRKCLLHICHAIHRVHLTLFQENFPAGIVSNLNCILDVRDIFVVPA